MEKKSQESITINIPKPISEAKDVLSRFGKGFGAQHNLLGQRSDLLNTVDSIGDSMSGGVREGFPRSSALSGLLGEIGGAEEGGGAERAGAMARHYSPHALALLAALAGGYGLKSMFSKEGSGIPYASYFRADPDSSRVRAILSALKHGLAKNKRAGEEIEWLGSAAHKGTSEAYNVGKGVRDFGPAVGASAAGGFGLGRLSKKENLDIPREGSDQTMDKEAQEDFVRGFDEKLAAAGIGKEARAGAIKALWEALKTGWKGGALPGSGNPWATASIPKSNIMARGVGEKARAAGSHVGRHKLKYGLGGVAGLSGLLYGTGVGQKMDRRMWDHNLFRALHPDNIVVDRSMLPEGYTGYHPLWGRESTGSGFKPSPVLDISQGSPGRLGDYSAADKAKWANPDHPMNRFHRG